MGRIRIWAVLTDVGVLRRVLSAKSAWTILFVVTTNPQSDLFLVRVICLASNWVKRAAKRKICENLYSSCVLGGGTKLRTSARLRASDELACPPAQK